MKDLYIKRFVIGTFVSLYVLVSLISTTHVVDFFELSNPRWMAITLAVAFELGAAASLASLVALEKMNKTIVWILFFAITAMQMNGNLYYAFANLKDYQSWVELFNLVEEDPLFQKRVLAFVSGAILPLVALGFIKSLVDYIRPDVKELELEDQIDSMRRVVTAHDSLQTEMAKIKEESTFSTEESKVEVEETEDLFDALQDDEVEPIEEVEDPYEATREEFIENTTNTVNSDKRIVGRSGKGKMNANGAGTSNMYM